jgi:PPOX class probable F420-dependent enzyme
MGIALTDAQRAFLDRPGTFARLATLSRDGAPQLTVMWYRRAGDTLRMVCGPEAAKARNIRRDPRVAVVVEHPDDPYRYFQFQGRAELLDDLAAGSAEGRALAHRYLGRERGDAYFDTVEHEPTLVLVVEVEHLTSFVGKNARAETAGVGGDG